MSGSTYRSANSSFFWIYCVFDLLTVNLSTHAFPVLGIWQSSCARDIRQLLSTILQSYFKHWNHQKENKNVENVALMDHERDNCLQCENWNKEAGSYLVQLQLGACEVATQILCHVAQVHEWLWKHYKFWFRGYKSTLSGKWISKYRICGVKIDTFWEKIPNCSMSWDIYG